MEINAAQKPLNQKQKSTAVILMYFSLLGTTGDKQLAE